MNKARTDHLIDLGLSAYKSHLYDTAAERLQKALELEPEDWSAMLYLAMTHLKSGEYDRANCSFWYIISHCPSSDLQQTARDALNLIDDRKAGRA